jgi:DHA1 family purine base/nucleoside efflux pump-like MFS transporter
MISAHFYQCRPMNPRIYLLALAAFAAGIDENLVGGILPLLSRELGVTLSAAGQLTAVFSLTFALCAAPLLSLTSRIERRTLLIAALLTFAVGNLGAGLAVNYWMLLVCRIISAASCALVVVLASTLSASLVDARLRGRAIGIVFMGISGSLVLGIPLGIAVSESLSWRAPFLLLALLAVVIAALLRLSLPTFASRPPTSLRDYCRQLAVPKLLLAQLVSVLLLTGHFVLFAYLAPYVQQTMGIHGVSLSYLYVFFGIAAICGGYCGGWLSDRLGFKRALVLIPALFTLVMALLPWATGSLASFLALYALWMALSWTISPVVQNYLLHTAPGSGEANVGINTSAMHLGVALGAALGGVVIAKSSLEITPLVGALVTASALAAACLSLMAGARQPRRA